MHINDELLYNLIGQRLKARREELGYSQAWLADRVGLIRTSITNIEAGRQKLPLHSLYEICLTLDVDPIEVLPTTGEVGTHEREEVVIDEKTRRRVPPETAKFIRTLVNEPRNSS